MTPEEFERLVWGAEYGYLEDRATLAWAAGWGGRAGQMDWPPPYDLEKARAFLVRAVEPLADPDFPPGNLRGPWLYGPQDEG